MPPISVPAVASAAPAAYAKTPATHSATANMQTDKRLGQARSRKHRELIGSATTLSVSVAGMPGSAGGILHAGRLEHGMDTDVVGEVEAQAGVGTTATGSRGLIGLGLGRRGLAQ